MNFKAEHKNWLVKFLCSVKKKKKTFVHFKKRTDISPKNSILFLEESLFRLDNDLNLLCVNQRRKISTKKKSVIEISNRKFDKEIPRKKLNQTKVSLKPYLHRLKSPLKKALSGTILYYRN